MIALRSVAKSQRLGETGAKFQKRILLQPKKSASRTRKSTKPGKFEMLKSMILASLEVGEEPTFWWVRNKPARLDAFERPAP